VSTANLAFVAGQLDRITMSIAAYKDSKGQMLQPICEVTPIGGVSRNLIVNRDAPPFDNPEIRRAMTLSLDRKAEGDVGGVMPAPTRRAVGDATGCAENIARL
jgi:peptide/nickel transport system substrate-binding protein